MTTYVEDESGSPVCIDCATGQCRPVDGWRCEAEHCQCLCKANSWPDDRERAAELDDRPADKLAVVAAELDRERTPDLRELTAERYQRPAAPESASASYTEWQRHRMCGRKVRYATQLGARKKVLWIWAEGRWASCYRCDYCTGWHITSSSEAAA